MAKLQYIGIYFSFSLSLMASNFYVIVRLSAKYILDRTINARANLVWIHAMPVEFAYIHNLDGKSSVQNICFSEGYIPASFLCLSIECYSMPCDSFHSFAIALPHPSDPC